MADLCPTIASSVAPSRRFGPMTRRLSLLLALTAIYFAAGVLGSWLAFDQSASAVWPAAGIAVGVLLRFGTSLWPAVAAGAFLVNVGRSGDIGSSAAIAFGNTLEALIACWLIGRYAGGSSVFRRANTAFRFALLAGLASPIVAASIATLAQWAGGVGEAPSLPVWF